MKSSEAKGLAGCFILIWQFFVTTPMWLILLYHLMSANEMPVFAWVLYWAYVPCLILGVIFGGIFSVFFSE